MEALVSIYGVYLPLLPSSKLIIKAILMAVCEKLYARAVPMPLRRSQDVNAVQQVDTIELSNTDRYPHEVQWEIPLLYPEVFAQRAL
jgi:hypothetical protein